MAMSVVQVREAVRAGTLHDNDLQTDDSQLDPKIDQSYRRLRRKIAAWVPELYQSTSTHNIAGGASTITLPADFERVLLLERQVSSTAPTIYYPVPAATRLTASSFGPLSWFERQAVLVLNPPEAAPGDYRLTYETAPASGYTSLDLPAGCEDIVIEEVCAWVRQRHDEDPTYHLRQAEQIWKEQKTALIKRTGVHPQPGLMRSQSFWRRW